MSLQSAVYVERFACWRLMKQCTQSTEHTHSLSNLLLLSTTAGQVVPFGLVFELWNAETSLIPQSTYDDEMLYCYANFQEIAANLA
eukprot:759307-Hanusia_phi.AAC.5